MARSITEIKSAICKEWMGNEDVARMYGFSVGDSFSERFSAVSVENILFYIVAVTSWVVERLVDTHRYEVDAALESLLPHRAKWYRDKALKFLKDIPLYEDSDMYDTSDMTEDEIEAARVVKYAAVSENADASILTIKVAGETNGRRSVLDAATAQQLENYLREVKDAGVRISLVNESADRFMCELKICYDGMVSVNGVYSNMALVDAIRLVKGVKIAEVESSALKANGSDTWSDIEVKVIPRSGYMIAKESDITLVMEEYL